MRPDSQVLIALVDASYAAFQASAEKTFASLISWLKKPLWTPVHNQHDAHSNSTLVIVGNDSIHWCVCPRRWQFEANHFQTGVCGGLNNVLPGHWKHLLSLHPLCYEWCVTEAKACVHARIHLTTATLIGLQPEDHKFASGSCGTKTTRGDCRGLDIQQAALSGPEPTRTAAGESIH